MLKSLVFILALILSFSSLSQYSQNIDTLSNKEIKQLIMSINGDHPVKKQLAKNETGKVVGFAFIATGIALLADASTRPGPANDSEIDIIGILQSLLGQAFAISGAGILVSAYIQYHKEIKSYKEYLREDSILSEIEQSDN